MKPTLIVQQRKPDVAARVRSGIGNTHGIDVVATTPNEFVSLARLDALFLTLPRAEAWGSKPLPPHTCEVLRTRPPELEKGFPPFVVTGVILRDEDPKTGAFTVQLVVRSAVKAIVRFNAANGNPIRTLGLAEVERFAPEVEALELGRLIRAAYEAALPAE